MVPESFRFVVKVYQGISGQGDWKPYYQTEEEMIAHFLDVMSPMVDAGKMFCFLVQFPHHSNVRKKMSSTCANLESGLRVILFL